MDERVDPVDLKEDLAKAYQDARKLRSRKRMAEIGIWYLLAMLVSSRFFLEALSRAYPRGDERFTTVALDHSTSIIISGLILLFPILCEQIFGELPLSMLSRRFGQGGQPTSIYAERGANVSIGSIGSPVGRDPASLAASIEAGFSVEAIKRLDPRELLALYAERTTELTKQIYRRAGVYLLVGVVIAFSGLAFFYIRSRDIPATADYVERALALLPGFGILFFIEFVAFFFLRQYRSAMDGFRYYDAIRRNREENLVILKMFAENTDIVSTKDVLAAMTIYSHPGKLGKDETTDILESRRLHKDEAIIFEKIIDAISAVKDSMKGKDKEK